jgi:hypothetical protein
LVNDIYLVFSYCAPSNSVVLQRAGMDVFDDLTKLLSECNNSGDLILTGDLNSRVGQSLDYLPFMKLMQWIPFQEIPVTPF